MKRNSLIQTPSRSEEMLIPLEVVQDADNLSKETKIPFRDCLEILMKAYLEDDSLEPTYQICPQ
jgi:hypothetical protein